MKERAGCAQIIDINSNQPQMLRMLASLEYWLLTRWQTPIFPLFPLFTLGILFCLRLTSVVLVYLSILCMGKVNG